MDRCEPGSALSDRLAWRQWRKVGYATPSFEGVMLIAGPETAAPEVTYPLDVAGWHAITIGVYGDQEEDTQVLVRLSGESVSSMLMLKPLGYEQGEEEGKMKEVADPGIHEMFWKAADLTGQSISFAPVLAGLQGRRPRLSEGPRQPRRVYQADPAFGRRGGRPKGRQGR